MWTRKQASGEGEGPGLGHTRGGQARRPREGCRDTVLLDGGRLRWAGQRTWGPASGTERLAGFGRDSRGRSREPRRGRLVAGCPPRTRRCGQLPSLASGTALCAHCQPLLQARMLQRRQTARALVSVPLTPGSAAPARCCPWGCGRGGGPRGGPVGRSVPAVTQPCTESLGVGLGYVKGCGL